MSTPLKPTGGFIMEMDFLTSHSVHRITYSKTNQIQQLTVDVTGATSSRNASISNQGYRRLGEWALTSVTDFLTPISRFTNSVWIGCKAQPCGDFFITTCGTSNSLWKWLMPDLIKKSVMKSIMTQNELLAEIMTVTTSVNGLISIHELGDQLYISPYHTRIWKKYSLLFISVKLVLYSSLF